MEPWPPAAAAPGEAVLLLLAPGLKADEKDPLLRRPPAEAGASAGLPASPVGVLPVGGSRQHGHTAWSCSHWSMHLQGTTNERQAMAFQRRVVVGGAMSLGSDDSLEMEVVRARALQDPEHVSVLVLGQADGTGGVVRALEHALPAHTPTTRENLSAPIRPTTRSTEFRRLTYWYFPDGNWSMTALGVPRWLSASRNLQQAAVDTTRRALSVRSRREERQGGHESGNVPHEHPQDAGQAEAGERDEKHGQQNGEQHHRVCHREDHTNTRRVSQPSLIRHIQPCGTTVVSVGGRHAHVTTMMVRLR